MKSRNYNANKGYPRIKRGCVPICILAGNGSKIFAEAGRKIRRDLLSFFGILHAKVVNAHHRVINEVRAHLQNHNARSLMRYFPLLPHILLYLVV